MARVLVLGAEPVRYNRPMRQVCGEQGFMICQPARGGAFIRCERDMTPPPGA